MNIIIFLLDRVRYAINVDAVDEVIPLPAITPLAKLPPFIRGIINLRGHAIPIMDLKDRLGTGTSYYELDNDVIIAKIHNKRIGLIVDDTLSIINVPDAIFIPPPDMINEIDIRYISAVAKINSDLIILLNLDNILNLNEEREFMELKV